MGRKSGEFLGTDPGLRPRACLSQLRQACCGARARWLLPFYVQSKGGRAKADIRAELANALRWDLAIPRHSVTVEVNGGLVSLPGIVERTFQKSCAEAIARRGPGVTDVRNKIAIRAAVEFSQPTLHP